MITAEHSVFIERPVEDVWAFCIKPENDTRWRSDLLKSEFTSSGPVSVGSTGRQVAQFLGRRVETDWEVTAFEENRTYSFKTTSGSVRPEGTFTLTTKGNGTTVSMYLQVEIGGVFKLAEPTVGGMARKQMESDLTNLKDLLESGEEE